MDHNGCSRISKATVGGWKVPHAAQQGACCAAHKHQGLSTGKKNKDEGREEELKVYSPYRCFLIFFDIMSVVVNIYKKPLG